MGDDISIQKVYNNYEKGWNGILENGLYSILFILMVHICFSIVEP